MSISKLERLSYAFEAYGYFIDAQPLVGEEEAFIKHLEEGFSKVEALFNYNAQTYNFKGKSKRALDSLHRSLPEPVWGVNVR